jgi:hypothetical protein
MLFGHRGMTADFTVFTAHNEGLHHPFIANPQTGSLNGSFTTGSRCRIEEPPSRS